MKNMIKIEGKLFWILFIIATISFSPSYAQTVITLNQPETGNQEHIAKENIRFLPGYHYKATPTESLHAFINPMLIGETNYDSIFTSLDFNNKTINTNLPVGTIEGSHSITPTGAATYSIPIKLPPGTNGMVPNLSIDYNSFSNKGFLGLGWNIGGVSKINRTSKNIYNDNIVETILMQNSDIFTLDGNRLIAISGVYGNNGTVYGEEQETFNKVTSFGSTGNGPSWFEVKTKQGLTMEFGNTNDSKNIPVGQNTSASWYVNKVTDNYGNYYSYHYKNEDNEILLDRIEYNDNTIHFFYDKKQDKNKSYVAGYPFSENVVLTSIVIKSEGELVEKYEFKYGFNLYTYLTEIVKYGSNNSPLNSTIFKYGDPSNSVSEENVAVNVLFPTTSSIDAEYWTGDYNGDGKTDLIGLSYDLIFNPPLPGLPPTTKYWHDWTLYINQGNNQFLSSAPQQFPVGFQPSDRPNSLNTGGAAGNAIIKNVDFNGDGMEDIVFSLVEQGSFDTYKFFPYLSTGSGFVPEPAFEEYAPTFSNGLEFTLRFIDFDGDGKLEIFTHHYNLIVNSPAFVDIRFNANDSDPKNLNSLLVDKNYQFKDCFPMDIDGDGRTELVNIFNISDSKYYYVRLNGNQLIFTEQAARFPTTFSLSESLYGDFNGDGKSDVISYYPTATPYWIANYSTGGLNAATEQVNLGSLLQSNLDHFVIDLNGDGKSDILEINNNIVNVYYSNGLNFLLQSYSIGISIDTENDEIDFGDFNGDGKPDMMVHKIGFGGGSGTSYDFFYFEKDTKERLLEGVADGFNNVTEFTYDYLTNNTIYTKGSTSNYPVTDVQSPLPVVTAVKIPDGVGGDDITSYTYEKAKVHKEGKGFLGFEKIIAENNVSGIKTITNYNLNTTYYINNPLSQNTSLISGGQPLSELLFGYTYTSLGNKRVFPFLSQLTNTDQLTSFTTTTTSSYDNFGNITQLDITKGSLESVSISNTFAQHGSHIPSSLISKVTQTTRQGESIYQRRTDYTYNNLGKVIQKTDDPTTAKELITSYGYNSLGNQTSATFSGTGITTKSINYVYDTKGRFIEKTTNALSQHSFATYDPKRGVPLTVTGIDGLTTTYEYDEFGTLISETTPDNLETIYQLGWDVGSGSAGNATTVNNSIYTNTVNTPGRSILKTWYDAFGRERKTEADGFSQKLYQITAYDKRGNIKTTTSPFYQGGATPVIITTNTYDNLNKIILSQNDAGSTAFSYTYNPNQVITVVTDKDNTTSSTTKDATGKVILASDESGETLGYAYYSSGLLRETTLNGIVIANSEYDLQGYQTKLTDKNAGVTEYEYNTYGELIHQKDANNNEYQIDYDVLGRMVKEEEIITGNTTNYTYVGSGNGINQLEKVIEDVNNISEEYTYDYLGRLIEMKETIDATDYKTTYGYDNFSNITSVTYPSGFIIENTYTQFGYADKVKNGSTIIWEATAMNSYNQYTSYDMGNGLSTTKTYDKYGLPDQFLVSDPNVQDLTFIYDTKNGNLLSREDITKGLLEEFSYDKLNRLTQSQLNGVIQQNINYANNGNIDFKTDAGNYTYDNNKINAALTATNPTTDISLMQQDITYNTFNSPATITEGVHNLSLIYGPNKQRKKTMSTDGTNTVNKYFLGDYEKTIDMVSGDVTEVHYIPGGDGLAAIYVIKNSVGAINYTYTDQLGSILTLTDDAGTIVAEQNFDAWGRYRDSQTWQLTTTSGISSAYSWLERGYTGHEHLNQFGLINMNGRVYDPILARMLSVDNFVQDATSTQNYNRYTYVLNNPLKFTDPSGEEAILIGIFIGALVGTYVGYKYGSSKGAYGLSLLAYTVGGGLIGAVSGALGAGVAAGGGAFANTGAIVVGSFSNSLGMLALTNGESELTVSYGFGSYNFNTNDFGYLGEEGNTGLQNLGYGLGALANISDAYAFMQGAYGKNVSEDLELVTNNALDGHSAITTSDGDNIVSVGPDRYNLPNSNKEFLTQEVPNGTNNWPNHIGEPNTTRIKLSNLNVSKVKQFARENLSAFDYKINSTCGFSCVTAASKALLKGGVLNLPVFRHPVLLQIQVATIRNSHYSYYFNQFRK